MLTRIRIAFYLPVFLETVMLYFNKGSLQENRGWVTDIKTFHSSDELYTHCQRNSATQSQVQFGSCNCIYQRYEWQLSWLHTTLLWGKLLYLHKFCIRILCLWWVWNSACTLCLLLLVVYDSLQGHGRTKISTGVSPTSLQSHIPSLMSSLSYHIFLHLSADVVAILVVLSQSL